MSSPLVDTRSHNVGTSDYSKHKIQPWDIWEEYKLNPWDADIVKRVLRDKEGDSRVLDYQKIIHVAQERIRQLQKDTIMETKHKDCPLENTYCIADKDTFEALKSRPLAVHAPDEDYLDCKYLFVYSDEIHGNDYIFTGLTQIYYIKEHDYFTDVEPRD